MSLNRHSAARGALVAAALAAAWIAPPAISRLMHRCPVRPDGVDQAEALPSFARKYKMSCSQCHAGYPVLNAYGRQFKMNGFVRERDGSDGVLKSQDGSLWTEAMTPWAVIVRARPIDNGHGNMSSQGAQMGGTAGPNPNGFQSQPINDVDAFIAGGDVARHISYLGELDANAPGGFTPGMGDIRLGWHPFQWMNVIMARRNFFADDPYQTIVSNETPTIANRATDLLMQGQGSISGNTMLTMQQLVGVNGQVNLRGDSFLYYAAGASKDSNTGVQGSAPTNGNIRLALDNGNGIMIGTFGSYGQERPTAAGGLGGNFLPGGVGNGTELEQFQRGGFDALWEYNGFAARGAFLYSHDYDSVYQLNDTNKAAYAELAYYYKRHGEDTPFLVPLVRENWLTTYNGTQQFNYVTAQLAHYFTPNLKGFIEYSVDTKRDYQNSTVLYQPTLAANSATLAPLGDRVSVQFEVGF
ncbi:MAG: hypothetical protein HKL90_07630 [Elusimicrobia bacterium]|nr:hypothetical protein [Elusimicrobiota bacterium]